MQMTRRDVLVVEGDDRAASGDLTQCVQVPVVAYRRARDHLRGRVAGALREQPQRDAERDRGLGHHPSQLAAPDDGEHGGRPESRAKSRARRGRSGWGHAEEGSGGGSGSFAYTGACTSNRSPRPRTVVINDGFRVSSPSFLRTHPRWTSMVLADVQKVVCHTSRMSSSRVTICPGRLISAWSSSNSLFESLTSAPLRHTRRESLSTSTPCTLNMLIP